MNVLSALISGILFGTGLWLSGMTDPAKVIGFLDVTGTWNPALMWVMIGAIAVFAPVFWWTRRNLAKPLVDAQFHPPAPHLKVDARLVGGSILFGIGWGLAGICPGPALVNAASATPVYLAFTFAMATTLLGLRKASQRKPAAPQIHLNNGLRHCPAEP